eukprot:scaffold29857_cov68-Phaeocystis_antarctica.AAC.2
MVAWALPQHDEHVTEVDADCTDPHIHLAVSESSVRLRLWGNLQIGNRTHHWQLQPDGLGDGQRLHDKPVDLAGLTPHQHLWLGRRAQLQAPHRAALVPKLAGTDDLRKARGNRSTGPSAHAVEGQRGHLDADGPSETPQPSVPAGFATHRCRGTG